jgi:DNA-binding MarR family transcriptional regulator
MVSAAKHARGRRPAGVVQYLVQTPNQVANLGKVTAPDRPTAGSPTGEPSPEPSREIRAARAIARASRLLERASDLLNLSQYRVLASIATGEERASRIASRLALGKPAISATVDSLRQRGLLTRREVDDDQRATALGLTPEGWAILAQVEYAMQQRITAVAELAADPAALIDALVELDRAIEAMLAERATAEPTAAEPTAAEPTAAERRR